MNVAATLSLNPDDAAIVHTALMYYADTILSGDEDEEFAKEVERDIERAENVRKKLRKSLERHGYSITV